MDLRLSQDDMRTSRESKNARVSPNAAQQSYRSKVMQQPCLGKVGTRWHQPTRGASCLSIAKHNHPSRHARLTAGNRTHTAHSIEARCGGRALR
nr:hypothetical protein XAC3615_12980004 [Xanthomonas citri pv. citri]CEH47917.1 hypothetical protein XAC3610_11260002 [Xanthomonas citri pv. citri]CEH57453.1 hypothetical protein XACS582_12780003 [Xanthomonas citri pv. citri]CEJ21416.1 hypothetical protein XACE116_11330002 [Xanthomonas citri pv. citri]CEJ26006.1 hypothetical protein XACE116_11330002 [Xanthomonas citri pv. citri]